MTDDGSRAVLVLLVAAGLGCSAEPIGGCRSSTECASGFACVDGRCAPDVDDSDAAILDGSTPADAGRDAAAVDAQACEATEMPEITCNGLDDDCDGYVDDVDAAGDGICDCLRIGVIGDPGTLASSSFQAWLEARGTTVVRFGLDDAPLTSDRLGAFDVLVLDRLRRTYSPTEADVLRAFVEGGGGVMTMTGYTGGGEDFSRPNTLLAPFGVAYAAGLHDGPVTEWEPHPVSMGVSSVTFLGGYLVDDPGGVGVVVGRLDGGVAGLALEPGLGRVFVWGDEWIQFDSEWSTMPMIHQLWANLLSWLGPRDRCIVLI